jgi:GNAT superfamily N-acetyltransferase
MASPSALELPAGVRAVTPADVAVVSHVLARAFRDDPTHRWFFPSERTWRLFSHRSFAALMRQNLEHGTVLTTRGREGGAIWAAPDAPEPGAVRQLLFALRFLPLFGRRIPLVVRGLRAIESAQPREPHWYLGVLGSDPPHQGKGVGNALIEPVLRRVDADRTAAWLEASRPENVPYYQRFGFDVKCEIALPEGPTVYGMLRDPRA